MLTRQEREQFVIDLYNEGKTIRDIAKEVRMSFRDIGVVLRKEEKEKERQMKQLDNNTTSTDRDSDQRGLSLSAQAYELFSQDKNPIQVAIELNLRESQVTKYYREYWKLKGLYKLNLVYEEIKDGITYFLKLYGLSKAARMSTDHVIRLLEITNNNLPALEDKHEKLQQNVNYRLRFYRWKKTKKYLILKSKSGTYTTLYELFRHGFNNSICCFPASTVAGY